MSGASKINPVWAVRDARNPALTFAHKAVLYAIATRLRGADQEAYPAGETLAGDAGGGDRQTRTILGELIAWGVVQKRRVVDGRGCHNQYRIDFDVLARSERFAAPLRRRRPPPSWTEDRSAAPEGPSGAPPEGDGSAPPEGDGGAPPEGAPQKTVGSGSAPPEGSGNALPEGSGSAPPRKIQEEETSRRDHDQDAGEAPPPRPVCEGELDADPAAYRAPESLSPAPPPSNLRPPPPPLVLELVPAAPPRRQAKRGSKAGTPEVVPEGFQELVDRYHEAWKAKKGREAPFPWGKREGDAAKRLLRGHGLKIALAAVEGAEVHPRWDGSFFAITNDPARWIRGSAPGSDTLTAEEIEHARAIIAANPDHPVAQTLRASMERSGPGKQVPSRKQFEWLMRDPDAGRRSKQHAPQKDAAFEVHAAWHQ